MPCFWGAIFILDLPILASYNVQTRFFSPPAGTSGGGIGFDVRNIVELAENTRQGETCTIGAGDRFSGIGFLRNAVASTILTIHNDSRITAKTYLDSLPVDAHYELTFYSPNMDEDRFENILGYPLIFKKFPDQELPEDSRFDYNSGEAGVEERKPDYLVASSFIYSRFHNAYTCELHQARL